MKSELENRGMILFFLSVNELNFFLPFPSLLGVSLSLSPSLPSPPLQSSLLLSPLLSAPLLFVSLSCFEFQIKQIYFLKIGLFIFLGKAIYRE